MGDELVSAAIRFAHDIVKLGVTYDNHNRTGFSVPHFGQVPPRHGETAVQGELLTGAVIAYAPGRRNAKDSLPLTDS